MVLAVGAQRDRETRGVEVVFTRRGNTVCVSHSNPRPSHGTETHSPHLVRTPASIFDTAQGSVSWEDVQYSYCMEMFYADR
jgi:hypothetical protein